jgi:LysM repeat protein
MGGRIIAGVIGFVVLVLLIQNYVLSGDDDDSGNRGRTGAAPTATLPAQTPVAISLGEQPAGGSTGSDPGQSGTYVVKDGDTLGSIATSFNVPPEGQAEWINEVLDLNGIADARALQAGQELQVPSVPAAATGTPSGTPGTPGPGGGIEVATATPTVGGDGDVYVVESGDTPFGIAEKFCVEAPAAWVNELVTLNDLNPNNLTVGQELVLPPNTSEC